MVTIYTTANEAFRLREAVETEDFPVLICGIMGPQGDAYNPEKILTAEEAEEYHSFQMEVLANAGVDFICPISLSYSAEAIGMCRAASKLKIPIAITFCVETDGTLPCGEPLKEAIEKVDAEPHKPAYFQLSCSHFDHFMPSINEGIKANEDWVKRIRGFRTNPSPLSHAELDNCTELQSGNPIEFGRQTGQLKKRMPWVKVVGGCCGSNEKHVEQIVTTLQTLRP